MGLRQKARKKRASLNDWVSEREGELVNPPIESQNEPSEQKETSKSRIEVLKVELVK